jgi:hypothetical protein
VARSVFYSFHYIPDGARAAQVRNAGVVEGNKPASDNDWEQIKRGGDAAIQRWIDSQFSGKSCAVVLIGAETAGRKWINYEIKKAWGDRKGLVGIYIHRLQNLQKLQSAKGKNPFASFTIDNGRVDLSSVVKAYDPPYQDSKDAYSYITSNLAAWIEEAIEIRGRH